MPAELRIRSEHPTQHNDISILAAQGLPAERGYSCQQSIEMSYHVSLAQRPKTLNSGSGAAQTHDFSPVQML